MDTRTTNWPPPDHPLADPHRNVGDVERWISGGAGAALVTAALQRRTPAAWLLGAAGAALLYRATTGHCPMFAAAGISTADETSTRRALSGPRGIHVDETVTIQRPAAELFRFWRSLENLPRVMRHLESVSTVGNRRSHWVAKGPAGMQVEWDAEIINEVPDKLIGWRSVEGSTIVSAGSVHFDQQADGSTRLWVRFQYEPPGGRLGAWAAWLTGQEPSVQVRRDLEEFKRLVEAGELIDVRTS
jgi:uncharacterized membrane protein